MASDKRETKRPGAAGRIRLRFPVVGMAGLRSRKGFLAAGGLALALMVALLVSAFTQKVWAVSVDGRVIGWTRDREATAAIVEEILRQDGASPSAVERVQYERISRRGVKPAAPEELRDDLARALLKLTEAWVIEVDGEPLVAVATEKDAQAVLTGLKESFPPAPDTVVKGVEIKEKVTVSARLVKVDKIRSVPDAVGYLLRGTDEARTYEVKSGDSLWSIARAHDLHVADLQQANPGVTERLQPGQKLSLIVPKPYITVVSREEKTVTEKIPFEVETVRDDKLYTYERKVRTPGQAGSKQVTYALVRENGQVKEQQVVRSTVEKEPVTQVVAVGTRKPAVVGTGRYIWPVSRGGGTITSRFGRRDGEFHEGVDIAAPTGTPVLAADSGVVVFAGWKGGYGKCVIIEHGNGSATLYGHLSQILVREGQKVDKGKTIGLVGSTGRSTGPHLHFEVMQGGVNKDPLKYFTHN